jgi:hypothetical protein
MESKPADAPPAPENESEPRPALKSYTTPALIQHGKLPALSLGTSLTDNDSA